MSCEIKLLPLSLPEVKLVARDERGATVYTATALLDQRGLQRVFNGSVVIASYESQHFGKEMVASQVRRLLRDVMQRSIDACLEVDGERPFAEGAPT